MAVNVEVAVIETREEWDALVATELARLGLTYGELARQARTGDFECEDARRVWLAVGGVR
jgi:hypothetical protein